MKVGIVGYGKMGSGIFRLLASKDLGVVVIGRDSNRCADAQTKYFQSLERAARRGRLKADEYERKVHSLRFSDRFDDLSSCDLVIETATEDFAAKVEIFRRMEPFLRPDAVLVTNTSSISIHQIAEHLVHPERFCGLHFFYPVPLIDLVEIIRTRWVQSETIAALQQFCTTLGRKCILVEDAPGSVVNAILACYYIEALYALEEGSVGPATIDRLAKKFFYVGPCESLDIVGIDFFVTALKRSAREDSICPVHWVLAPDGSLLPGAEPVHAGLYAPALLSRLLLAERFGRKVGKGIYRYENDRPCADDPHLYRTDKAPYLARQDQNEQTVQMRLLYAVYKGCLASLQRGMASAAAIDVGMREVLQMPKGPLELMRDAGREEVARGFQWLEGGVGERFAQEPLEVLWHRVQACSWEPTAGLS